MLKINNLNKKFSNGRGIFDLNLEINKGEVFGFLGPNGAGKTTTLKIIVGLLQKNSGEILFMDKKVEENFEETMQSIGCMFESVVHYDEFSAYDNMKFVARLFPKVSSKARINEMLELVGLSDVKREKVSRFSLGMRQRLAIAQAMYNSPSFMILDEPLNGLDIQGMLEIREIITDLASRGVTFLISSHLAGELEKVCTHVGIIKDGKMIDVSKVSDINTSIEDYYVEKTDGEDDV